MSGSEWDGEFEGDKDGEKRDKAPRAPRPARAARAARPGRRRGALIPTLVVLVVLAIATSAFAGVWTDYLWYDSVGFSKVFTTVLGTRVLLFAVGFLVAAALIAASLILAYRHRPFYVPVAESNETLEQYREAIEPVRRWLALGIPLVVGALAGAALSSQWRIYLLWRNQVRFGTDDLHFGKDIGFFVFSLPWILSILSFLTMILIAAILAGGVTHYVYAGLTLPGRGPSTRAALIQLGGLGAALALVRAAAFWYGRYALVVKQSSLMTGIGYTDDHAILPTRVILAFAAVVCAILFLSVIVTHSWRLPMIGVALLAILTVVVGTIYPAIVQSVKVNPSQKALETPYLQKNIDATRTAYGLDGIDVTPRYDAKTTATAGQLRDDAATIPGIRLVDPIVVAPTFRQLQALKDYYAFPDALDVDRYTIDGKESDMVVAVRELNLDGVPSAQRNWLNDHTVYTHGFGVVAAYGNRRAPDGGPVFAERNIPSTGDLPRFEPRIYFGEQSPDYSIVGGVAADHALEFDYQDKSGQKNTTYAGTGGVPIGSFLRQAAYAIKYKEVNFLLSNTVSAQSRILDHRTPLDRVKRVAPWLTLDGNPYPTVVDGRVLWVVDGYTTSDHYPYSSLQNLDQATSDSTTERLSSVTAITSGNVNYLRNSVKATVDAYDGTVHLYAWDESDPVLRTWMKTFPGTVEPTTAIKGTLMSHLRYPEDLFKVQRQMLSRYHVEKAEDFFGGNDFWKVPDDPAQEGQNVFQPPYYLTLQMPEQDRPTFSLTTTFMPTGDREVLSGFLAVDSDAGNQDGVKATGYGKLRMLVLPRDSSVKGPGQVQNDINSSNDNSPDVALTLSQFLNTNRSAGSKVTLGNLLTLPVGGGLLYVEPIYVSANTTSAYPLNRVTVVAFGDKLAWAYTLEGALNGLFGGDYQGDGTPTTPTSPQTPGNPGTPSSGDVAALDKALQDLQKAFADGQAALKAGDFAKYGEAQKAAQDALARAIAAAPKSGTASVTN